MKVPKIFILVNILEGSAAHVSYDRKKVSAMTVGRIGSRSGSRMVSHRIDLNNFLHFV